MNGCSPSLHQPLVALVGSATSAEHALSLTLVLGFVALYSTTGGLRSVISTDVMQFALMIVGTALYAFLRRRAAGGFGPMLDGWSRNLARSG